MPIVHLYRRKIGVKSERRIQRRRESVESIQRRVVLIETAGGIESALLDRREAGHNVQSDSLIHSRHPGHFTHDRRVILTVERHPGHLFIFSTDTPAEIKTPGIETGIKWQRLEGDFYFCHPGIGFRFRRRFPNSIPVQTELSGRGIQRIMTNTV